MSRVLPRPDHSQAVVESEGEALRLPEDPAARLAFSDRAAGNMSLVVGDRGDVPAARARLAAMVGLTPDRTVFMEQVHGAGVGVVGTEHRGRGSRRTQDAVAGVDALVTRDADLALVVLVADCVPVLLVDPGRAVAAAHAGRRGIVDGVVPACVQAVGDDPGRLRAVVGPSVGACCYEVPDDLAEAVAAHLPVARARTRWGTAALDLRAAVVHQLEVAGVGAVRSVGSCTMCDGERWFSHRGDAPREQGRQAGIVCRRDSSPGMTRFTEPGDRVA